MSSPVPLDPDRLKRALARLESAWRQQGAPIASCLRPGLSYEAIQAAVVGTGLWVPDELRWWWGWHNGAEEGSGADNLMGLTWHFISLEQALDVYRWERQSAPAVEDVDLTEFYEREVLYWRSTWLPVVKGEASVAFIDLVDGCEGSASPVRVKSWGWDIDELQPQTASLTEAAEFWAWLLEQRYYWWDAGWHERLAEVPESTPLNGLL